VGKSEYCSVAIGVYPCTRPSPVRDIDLINQSLGAEREGDKTLQVDGDVWWMKPAS
jgi:hypothetical protein